MYEKRWLISTLSAILVLSLLVGCKPAPAPTPTPAPKLSPPPTPAPAPTTPAPKPAEVIKWRMQTAMPPAHPFIALYCKAFVERVKEKGKGGLEIEYFAQGQILAPADIFKGVVDGKVEMGGSAGAFHGSLLPEALIEFALPYSLATNDQFYDFYYKYRDGAFLKKLQEAYREKGTQLLAVLGVACAIMTKSPINKVDDLKGKKILGGRAPSIAKLIQAAGGIVVAKPLTDDYTDLQTGAADGIIQAIELIIGPKLHEVTSHISLPPVGFAAPDLYYSLAAFNKLPPDLQKAVQEAAVEAALNAFGPGYPAREAASIEAAEKAGMKVDSLVKRPVANILRRCSSKFGR